MRLIGINGFKESGKDTTYTLIKEIEAARPVHAAAGIGPGGRTVARAGFADKLKIMAAKALGFVHQTDEECITLMNEAKESWLFDVFAGAAPGEPVSRKFCDTKANFTGREYLQWFGGEARGVFGTNFWIDQVLPTVDYPGSHTHQPELERRYPDVDILCITDVRYQNEAERVRALGGEVWEIIKPGLQSDGHGSEIPLPRDLVDVEIYNDGSIADLKNAVRGFLELPARAR